jgi:N-acetylglucosamine-6-phosphate deacetylase
MAPALPFVPKERHVSMNQPLLIADAEIITPATHWQRGWLLCEDGRIDRMSDGDSPTFDGVNTINAPGLILLPGFIDIHVHGGVGHEVMDAKPHTLWQLAKFYAEHGCTSFLATTWTDTHERILAALQDVAEHVGAQPDGATVLGAHLEGPFLNPEKCGAQNTDHIRRARREEALEFLDIGVIRLLALAPEYDENHWLIRECVQRGILVSAAHTSATYDQIHLAVEMGLKQTTHTFNAMTGLHHREPGTLGAALTMPELRCELIADNIHVHPGAMSLLYRAKGADGVILITDAVRGAGMPDGEYPIDDRVTIVRDGAVRLPDGTLAGSTLTMDKALFNFMQATDRPLAELWKCSSLNAARAIGVSAKKGSIEVGKDADLVLVDASFNVHLTVVEGRVVYRRGP